MHSLLGMWSLVDWRRVGNDGKTVHPLGENPVGLLVYLPGGAMIVQMLAKDRPLIKSTDPIGGSIDERAQAYSTCLAYFGTFKVVGDKVEHDIEASLYPNWSAKLTSRGYAFENGQLVLRTDPAIIDGVSVVNEMYWERPAAAIPSA